MFSDSTKSLSWLFLRHCLSEVFQTLHGYNITWGLLNHTIFDKFDHVSWLHYVRNLDCQLCFPFLVQCSLKNAEWLSYAFCDSCVYLRVVLHMNEFPFLILSSYVNVNFVYPVIIIGYCKLPV